MNHTPATRGDLAGTYKQTLYNNLMMGAYAGYETDSGYVRLRARL